MTKTISLEAEQEEVPPFGEENTAPAAKKGRPRIPKKADGIQHNGCKNPQCTQFGTEPPEEARRGVTGPYALSGTANAKGTIVLRCNACGEMPPLKSNAAIAAEVRRISFYLRPREYFCPEETCENSFVPVGTPGAYVSHGLTPHGTQRHKCKSCGRTFAVGGKPDNRQRETHRNREIFAMLVNKVPFARIVRMLGISWETLYHRIDFIHSQCMAFVARREARLKTLPVERLYLAVDAQDYIVNWTERHDKKNVVLKALTASDNATGYVLVSALNFDDKADRDLVEADAESVGDNALPGPYRKHARYWLASDYAASVAMTERQRKKKTTGSLQGDISAQYTAALGRADIEAFDGHNDDTALPSSGMQTHSDYTMIAVFHHLKRMLGNVGKWRFFMDQESGIRAACLGSFKEEIKARNAEAFYVRIEKGLVQEDKRERLAAAKARFAAEMAARGETDEEAVALALIKEEIDRKRVIGGFGDKWVSMPLPTMSEPEKAVCWLTAHGDFRKPDGTPDEDHVAWLYNKASMHSADTYFMKIRRSISMCERAVHSSSVSGRTYNAYQAYDPSVLKKLLEIYRVHHNYTDLPMHGKKAEKTTPAMRLGLADAPLDFKDILYFR